MGKGIGIVDILNLGCGNKLIADAVNHDRIRHRPEVDVAHDLELLPWPWPDNSFDMVVACAVLEHLRITLLESVGECWRILRPDGILHLKLPFWAHEESYTDPTHFWRYNLRSLDVFDPSTIFGSRYGFYTSRKWKLIEPPVLNAGRSSFAAKMQVLK